MPELPEAETIAQELSAQLTGKRLGKVLVLRPDIVHGSPQPLGKLLSGRRIRSVHRRAKRVILTLTPPAELIFCFGMSGRIRVCPANAPVEPHTHLRIKLSGSTRELRFRDPRRFGGVWCLAGGKSHVGRKLGPLGPEPLPMTPAEFQQVISRRRQIKALLLDQRLIAGLGNIYCDEALHAAGIHPLTQAGALDAVATRRLLRAIKSTLRHAIRMNGSTLTDYLRTDGRRGSFQKYHRVYQHVGKPCRSCGTVIERLIVAGRSTFVCTVCQPLPVAE
ncbi:MAG: bifunctional DNA-formamidopyrimidine glycosylase/DNA-(apurinic or apyrimidinic site) lyase [Planctomycetes bacterium]|nr:bifunctional DNA-formamidopyrimidine glycosylase/DNA-(apurinic or apyrimidinic site) lyase [Planctomycetota bacterium]